MQCRILLAHRLIVSRPADRAAGPCQQTRQRPGEQRAALPAPGPPGTTATATAARSAVPRRRRPAHRRSRPAPARSPRGIFAAQCAIRNNHHSSGPVNRISSCAPDGQNRHSAAAAVPSTVIGAISAATARLAAADTRLTRPEMPAISGAVTNCAAHATQTASASGLGQPAATRRRDQIGAMTTSAAVATTDKARPDVDGQLRRDHHQQQHGGRPKPELPAGAATTARPPRRSRPSPPPATRWRVGCTTMTNSTKAMPANADRGPRADQPRRKQHRSADDRDVGPGHRGQVRQTGRAEFLPGHRGDGRHVAEDQRRQHRRLVGGQHATSRVREPGADRVRGPVHRPGAAQSSAYRSR